METLNIPEGYQQLMPYLILENATGFIDFTKTVFGAEEKHLYMRDEKLIMHAEISINGSVIMLADATEEHKKSTAGMFLYVKDADSVYQKAIANGATSAAEPADQPYGRSAGMYDPFGNTWWLTSA